MKTQRCALSAFQTIGPVPPWAIVAAVAVSLLSWGQAARAGTVSNSTIRLMEIAATGFADIYPADGYLSPPACSTEPYPGAGRRLVFDTRTPGGRSILATAIAARMSGSRVYIHGNGTCDLWAHDSESVDFISILP